VDCINFAFVPAQVDLLVDFSNLIGPILVFFGVELMLVGTFEKVLSGSDFRPDMGTRQRFVGIGGMTVGLLFATSGALRMLGALELYVVFLFCLGRIVEGAGIVRFYKRVIDFLRGKGGTGGIRGKVKHGLFLLFIFVLAAWLCFRVLTKGPIVGSTVETLRLIWTGFVVITAGAGIARKLGYSDENLNRGLKTGMILAVVGAEVYNLRVQVELAAYIAGSLAYSVGFWLAVYYLFNDSFRSDR